jgi:hypothetical protein
MNRHWILPILVISLILMVWSASFAVEAAAVTDTSLPVIPDSGRVVVAYYFYRTLRCDNCLRIEAWSKDALDSAFSAQLLNGLLWWRPLNTDLPDYTHFIEEYKLETKSLVVAEFHNGQRVRWKICERVWDLLEDKGSFTAYVQAEVNSYLAKD